VPDVCARAVVRGLLLTMQAQKLTDWPMDNHGRRGGERKYGRLKGLKLFGIRLRFEIVSAETPEVEELGARSCSGDQ